MSFGFSLGLLGNLFFGRQYGSLAFSIFLFLFAGLSFLQFLHLAGYLLFLLLAIQFFQAFAEIGQFLSGLSGFLFFGLCLLDATYGVLNTCIGLLHQLFGFFFGFTDNFLARLLKYFGFSLIAGYGFLHLFFTLADVLSLRFPVTLVAYNVLQILVTLYIFAAHYFRGIGNDLFRQSDFAGNLYSK